MNHSFTRLYYCALTFLCGFVPLMVSAQIIHPIKTVAPFAYILDTQTKTVLLDHNGDARMYPASMTKIMTVYMAFRALDDGILQWDDQVLVSRKANRMGGSRMFIEQGKYVSVKDLLYGIIIQSGNDASVAIAEHLGGNEAVFAELMNATAADIGLTGTHFVNASGWPDDNHYTTARDLATLTAHMINEYPEHYKIFAQKTFTYSGITQKNRNGLIGVNGVDGVKTGHTEAAGYGLVSSADINRRRLITVVNGLESANKRQAESSRLMNWAFRSTESRSFYVAGQTVSDIPVWYGQKNTLNLVTPQNIILTTMRNVINKTQKTITFDAPLKAPIRVGQQVAELHIHTDTDIIARYPLFAAEDIPGKNFFQRLQSNIDYLLWGVTP